MISLEFSIVPFWMLFVMALFRLSGNSAECMHFFTLPEGPFMLRKIKPQRAQRITESCYFYLSPPLCHSVSSVVFRNFISKISKVSGVLVTATRDTKDPLFNSFWLYLFTTEGARVCRDEATSTPLLCGVIRGVKKSSSPASQDLKCCRESW